MLIVSFVIFAFTRHTRIFTCNVDKCSNPSFAIFALRAIYYALLEEGGIPVVVTGTATGFISMIGFTPDIFMPLLGGILLDSMPTIEGYRAFFISVAVICGLGLAASIFLYRIALERKKNG